MWAGCVSGGAPEAGTTWEFSSARLRIRPASWLSFQGGPDQWKVDADPQHAAVGVDGRRYRALTRSSGTSSWSAVRSPRRSPGNAGSVGSLAQRRVRRDGALAGSRFPVARPALQDIPAYAGRRRGRVGADGAAHPRAGLPAALTSAIPPARFHPRAVAASFRSRICCAPATPDRLMAVQPVGATHAHGPIMTWHLRGHAVCIPRPDRGPSRTRAAGIGRMLQHIEVEQSREGRRARPRRGAMGRTAGARSRSSCGRTPRSALGGDPRALGLAGGQPAAAAGGRPRHPRGAVAAPGPDRRSRRGAAGAVRSWSGSRHGRRRVRGGRSARTAGPFRRDGRRVMDGVVGRRLRRRASRDSPPISRRFAPLRCRLVASLRGGERGELGVARHRRRDPSRGTRTPSPTSWRRWPIRTLSARHGHRRRASGARRRGGRGATAACAVRPCAASGRRRRLAPAQRRAAAEP